MPSMLKRLHKNSYLTPLLGRSTGISVGILLFSGIVIRLFLFDFVPVNADTGLYLYDAYLYSNGFTPIADYPSRSPLFIVLLSSIFELGFDPLVSVRFLMIGNTILAGLGIYLFAARVHSTQAAQIALALFLFAPISIFWGFWLKTETIVVVWVLFATYRFYPRLRKPRIPTVELVFLGFVSGVGFLVRRTMIFLLLGGAVFLLYYRLRYFDRSIGSEIAGTFLVGFTALASILLGYVLVSQFDTAKAWVIARKHLFDTVPLPLDPLYGTSLIAILISAFAFIGISGVLYVYGDRIWKRCPITQWEQYTVDRKSVSYTLAGGITTLLLLLLLSTDGFSLCQPCSEREGEVVAEILYVMFPIALVGFIVGLKRVSEVGSFIPRWLSYIVLFSLAIWVSVVFLNQSLPLHGYDSAEVIALGIFTLLLISWVLMRHSSQPDWDRVRTLGTALILVFTVTLILLYLLRNRIIFITYSQEILPYVAILAGIIVAELVGDIAAIWRGLFAVSLVVAILIGAIAAPHMITILGGVSPTHNPSTGTVSSIQDASDALREVTQPRDVVFSAQLIFPVQAGRQNALNFSRVFWDYKYSNGKGQTSVTAKLKSMLEEREIAGVVVDSRTQIVFETAPRLRSALEKNYCRVPLETFERVGATLYLPAQSACENG